MSAAAVVLAAGASRRLGRPKQLLELEGEPLVRRTARLCLEAGFDPVLVVLGCATEDVEAALESVRAVPVFNTDWKEGMAASIRAGLAALPGTASGALLLPCDQPALTADLLREFLHRHGQRPGTTLASEYGGGAGVPALFPRDRFPELLTLKGDRGAKAMLGMAERIPFPDGAIDLDSAEDLSSWLSRSGPG